MFVRSLVSSLRKEMSWLRDTELLGEAVGSFLAWFLTTLVVLAVIVALFLLALLI